MKEQNTTTKRTRTTNPAEYRAVWELETVSEELQLCEVIRYLDLRAMHQSNGYSDALNAIINGCFTDKTWSNTDNRQNRADELKAMAKEERELANKARRTISNIKATAEQRNEALANLTAHTLIADSHGEEAHDIERDNSALTASLAQDMLHAIYLELQAIKADQTRHTDEAFSELCKVGREYIQNMSGLSIVDSVKTISRPLSKTEAIHIMTLYGIDPATRPRQKWSQNGKGCIGYYTLEAKARKRDTDPAKVDPATIANYAHYNDSCIWFYENITIPGTDSAHHTAFPALDAKHSAMTFWNAQTDNQKAVALGLDPAENNVLYLVLHIPTIRAHSSIEVMTDHDPDTAEEVTDHAQTAVDVVAIAHRAKLSEQARTAVKALTDPEAVARAQIAYNDTMAKGIEAIETLQADRAEAGKKPYAPGKIKQMQEQYKQTANNAYNSALWEYALTKAGYTKTAQAKAKSVIVSKLTKAYREAPDSMTPGAIDYARIMGNTHRGNSADRTPRVDYVAIWTEADTITIIDQNGNKRTANKPNTIAPTINWTESGHTPEALTPEEVVEIERTRREARAEYLNAHADDIASIEYRRQLRDHTPKTVFPHMDAQTVALFFWEHMTEAERIEAIRKGREEARARSAREAEKRRAVRESGIYSLNSTFEQWKAWTAEERAEHMRFIQNINK